MVLFHTRPHRPRHAEGRSTLTPDRSRLSAILLVVCVAWASLSWLSPAAYAAAWPPSLLWHKVASVALATLLSIDLFIAVTFERTK